MQPAIAVIVAVVALTVACDKIGEAIDGLVSAVTAFQRQAHEFATGQTRLRRGEARTNGRLTDSDVLVIDTAEEAPLAYGLDAKHGTGLSRLRQLERAETHIFAERISATRLAPQRNAL